MWVKVGIRSVCAVSPCLQDIPEFYFFFYGSRLILPVFISIFIVQTKLPVCQRMGGFYIWIHTIIYTNQWTQGTYKLHPAQLNEKFWHNRPILRHYNALKRRLRLSNFFFSAASWASNFVRILYNMQIWTWSKRADTRPPKISFVEKTTVVQFTLIFTRALANSFTVSTSISSSIISLNSSMAALCSASCSGVTPPRSCLGRRSGDLVVDFWCRLDSDLSI